MRLTKAEFAKVGPFKKLSLDFEKNKRKDLAEVHILTGPNGSGKSTVLRCLSYFFATSKNRDKYAVSVGDLFWTSGSNGSYVEAWGSESNHFAVITTSGHKDDHTDAVVTAHKDQTDPFYVYRNQTSFYRILDKETLISYAVFGYSGQRQLRTSEYMFGDDLEMSGSTSGSAGNSSGAWNPFTNSVDFERNSEYGVSLENWVETILKKAAFAAQSKDTEKETLARASIDRFEKILAEITGRSIRFKVDVDVYKTVVELDGKELGFRVLTDGLKSILSWLGDLIMRMESIRWEKKQSIFDQPIILFLDEIDIHLHPSWQKKILPIIQKTFVNAQIFVSTHSPFVVASVEDAYVYDLNIGKDGHAFLENVIHTERGQTYSRVLKEIFDVETDFADPWTLEKLPKFYELLKHVKSKDTKAYKDAFSVGKELAEASIELRDIVSVELNQLDRRIAAVK